MTDTTTRGRDRNRALVRAGIAAVVARGSTSVATLLLTPLLAHLLGIQGYGVFVTLTATSALLLLGDIGIASGLVSKLSNNTKGPEHARAIISSAYAVVMGASAIAILAAAILAIVLPWNSWTGAAGISGTDIHVAAFLALTGAALQVTTNLGQKIELSRQRGDAASLWLGIANIGAPVVATALAALTHDLRWTVAGMALTPPLVMFIQSRRVLRSLPEEMRPHRRFASRSQAKELMVSGAQFSGIAVLGAIAFQLDTLIVSSFLGSEAAAKYSVTIKLFALVSTTIHVAVTQLWSAFADATMHGDVHWARRMLVRATLVCTGLAAVLSAGLFVFGHPLIRLWLSSEFLPSTALLAAAALWTVVSSGAAPLAFFINGNEKQRQLLIVGFPMAVCNVALSIVLVQVVGASGVLWASSIAWLAFVSIPMGIMARNVLREQELAQREAGTTEIANAAPVGSFAVTSSVTEPSAPETREEAVPPDEEVPAAPQKRGKSYRPDVDGLRALAVMAVIGFHYFPGSFPGGFIGVDVFFVVSGFLITGLIAHRLDAGTFTIRNFYARRIRRIFPALFVVLVATMVVGWLVLFTDEFHELARQAGASSFFVANFHFMLQASYFDPGSYAKPLLHLWSLAIEEQFYLVWPVLMLVLLRRSRRVAIWAVVALTALSFAFNVYLAATDPSADYYSPLTRFWQLSIGGLIALSPSLGNVRSKLLANLLSVVGLLVIAYGVLNISKSLAYPGYWGLVPALGTAMVIVAGQTSIINRRLLSLRLAVGIGLISYPLYLWHWPMISLLTIVGQGFPTIPVRGVLVLLSFGLATLTYFFVEKPLRVGRFSRRSPRKLAVGVGFVGVASFLVASSLGPASAHGGDSGPIAKLGKWNYVTNSACNNRYTFSEREGGWWFCVTNHDKPAEILLLGDSLANELYPGMVKAYPDRTVLSIGTCAPTQGTVVRPAKLDPQNPCFASRAEKQERFMDTVVDRNRIPFVVISMTWPQFDAAGNWVNVQGARAGKIFTRDPSARGNETDRDAFVSGLDRRITALERNGDQVVLWGPKPEIGYDITHCFARPFNSTVQSCQEPRAQERTTFASFESVADDIIRKHPKVTFFDPNPVFCTENTCSLLKGNQALLRDQFHLSVYGSTLVGQEFKTWARTHVRDLKD